MESRFNHTNYETELYQKWQDAGAFQPTVPQHGQPDETFSVIMPPPNANDPLHVGHAMFVALEDALVRFNRMRGRATTWIPGTDHAGIETQFVFEKKLKKLDKSRFDFDRQTLYDKIWEYVQENSGIAVDQIKKLGASADWSRFRFTLDEPVVSFVVETFSKLAADGLVYRDLRLVNFCVSCGTSFSELEVDHKEQTSPLYYVRYYLADKPEEYVVVATTRPEPIWADTHLAVHPKNPKTKKLIGAQLLNPLTDAVMTVVTDEFVDPEFGTGIVKLTPAHDPNDFAVAKKLQLPIIEAVDRRGKITPGGGVYAGMTTKAARAAVVADLQASGHIEKIDENYQNRIGVCYRCGRVIEPLPLPQFFVKVNAEHKSLTKNALKALDDKSTIVHGAGREKILRHWLENLEDWNISRQIVWGIRIPVWYKVSGFEEAITLSFVQKDGTLFQGTLTEALKLENLATIEAGLQQLYSDSTVPYTISHDRPADGAEYLPETDTFDTWFSSAQWPVVTLKTAQPDDFKRFYPTSVMETGYDILPFWVMRMMLLGIYLTGETPFKNIYLHGLVRDAKGQKMSKSKGNVINPLEIIEKFGTDALRLALVIRTTPGSDKSVGEPDFKAARNFANKLWNASRFIILQHQAEATPPELQTLDAAVTAHTAEVTKRITGHLENFRIGLAADELYNEFWHWFCDECIEQSKKGEITLATLTTTLITFIKMLHPFMPYVTEQIWHELKAAELVTDELLITAPWPQE